MKRVECAFIFETVPNYTQANKTLIFLSHYTFFKTFLRICYIVSMGTAVQCCNGEFVLTAASTAALSDTKPWCINILPAE